MKTRNTGNASKEVKSQPYLKSDILKIRRLRFDDCVPMPELERDYYPPDNYQMLKRIIEDQGLKKCYAIRVIWNEKLKKFEIFCGIHRWMIGKSLGIYGWIPAIDETGMISREQAIAEGINDNSTHAAYNPMDKAKHLKIEGEMLAKQQRHDGAGRPSKYCLDILAGIFKISESHIGNLIQMTEFPEDVQDLIGLGKLYTKYAFLLERLIGTAHKSLISRLAHATIENNWSYEDLKSKVATVINKGSFNEGDIKCTRCGKLFTRKEIKFPAHCPQCLTRLKKEHSDSNSSEEVKMPRTDEDRKEFMHTSKKWNDAYCGKVKICKVGCEYCRHYWIARGVIGRDAENMVKALVDRANGRK